MYFNVQLNVLSVKPGITVLASIRYRDQNRLVAIQTTP